jgi:hypothetical protein
MIIKMKLASMSGQELMQTTGDDVPQGQEREDYCFTVLRQILQAVKSADEQVAIEE